MDIKIQHGFILKSPKFKEPFIVEIAYWSGDLLKVAGYYINSRVSDYFILTLEDIKEIEIVSNPLDFKGDPEAVMLAVESAQTCGIQVWK